MLREIKEIRRKDREKKLQIPTEEELEALQKQIEELESKTQLIPYRSFNWIQKHITQRKAYKEYFNQKIEESKNEEIVGEIRTQLSKKKQDRSFKQSELEREYEAEEKITTLEDMGLDFKSATEFLKSRGERIVLNEEDKHIVNISKDEGYEGTQDFILVHKGNYLPKDSRLQSTKEAQATRADKVTLNGEEYSYSYEVERDTVHFSVNGEVSSHAYGQWDDCKYAILVPFDDIPRSQIKEASAADTFTKGGVDLSSGTWILCPKGEIEKARKSCPEASIIEYEGPNVTGYANTLLSNLGYKYEDMGMWSWSDSKSDEQYKDIMTKEGLTFAAHSYTEYSSDEKMLEAINKAVSILGLIKRNGLISNKEQKKDIIEQLRVFSNCNPTIDTVIGSAFGKNMKGLPILFERLSAEGIKIPKEYQEMLESLEGTQLGYIKELDDFMPDNIDRANIDIKAIESDIAAKHKTLYTKDEVATPIILEAACDSILQQTKDKEEQNKDVISEGQAI